MAIQRNVVAGCCIPTTNFADFGRGWGNFAMGSGSESTGLVRPADGLPESDALPGAGSGPRGALPANKKRPQRRSAAAWKRAPLLSGAVVSCCPLRWRGPATCGRPNVPMTVRDLAQRDWEWPSSGPPERGPVPVQAWVREPALVQPWAQQAWVLQAWALQAWVLQAWVLRPWVLRPWVQPPSFWRGSFWRWPFWLTFSALPPSTSWRISSLPSWPFSPTSSKISSRLFSSPLQAFYSF